MHVHRVLKEYLREMEYETVGDDVIEIGDFLVIVSNKVKPANSQNDATGVDAAARAVVVQDKVTDIFAGIAMQGKRADETPRIRVAVDAIMDISVAALGSAANPGDGVMIGVGDDETTGTAQNQVGVIGSTNRIGTLTKPAAIGDTVVNARIIGVGVKAPPVAD